MEDEIPNDSSTPKRPNSWILLLAATPLVAAGLLMTWATASNRDDQGRVSWTTVGAIGDWWGGHFGAAAALASAILFFYAVWIQHSELQATRIEMREARKVHNAQRTQLERQATIAEKAAQQTHIFDVLERRQALYDHICKFYNADGELLPTHRQPEHGRGETLKITRRKLYKYDTYLDKIISISRLNNTEQTQVRDLADLFPHGLQNED